MHLLSQMWLMGCIEAADYVKHEPFTTRKLGPLIPRPISSSGSGLPAVGSCLSGVHGADLVALSQQHLEQSKREFKEQAEGVVSSSRWNPTPEQLRILEELYRRGTRTPSADQIQHITAQLRKYGKIEGKNVFYWFQNHKARERQKRRRQMETPSPVEQHRERKEPELAVSTKNWAQFTSCSTPLAEEPACLQSAAMADRRPDAWSQTDDGVEAEVVRSGVMERNGTWKTKQLSCPFPIRLINSATCLPSATNHAAMTCTPSITKEETTTTLDPQLFKTRKLLNSFIKSRMEDGDIAINDDGSTNEFQTLQLFPIQCRSNGDERDSSPEDRDSINSMKTFDGATENSNIAGFQFYEFLPLKH